VLQKSPIFVNNTLFTCSFDRQLHGFVPMLGMTAFLPAGWAQVAAGVAQVRAAVGLSPAL